LRQRVFENIIRRTPIDSGFARNNWDTSLNAPVDSPPKQGADPAGGDAITQVTLVIGHGEAGDVFRLQNGVPYILALEHGHSQQAPAGMSP
jgi:hypothetical protein